MPPEMREREGSVFSIDRHLSYQLEAAVQNHQDTVTLLDLGCGLGEMLSNIANDPATCPNTKSILAKHPHLRLNLVGLTDTIAHDQDQPHQIKDLVEPGSTPSQIQACSITYTLTAAQRLPEFLKMFSIDAPNLIISHKALTYLGPKTFGFLLQDITLVLPPEGEFFAIGYALANMPGFFEPIAGKIDFNDNRDKQHLEDFTPEELETEIAKWKRVAGTDLEAPSEHYTSGLKNKLLMLKAKLRGKEWWEEGKPFSKFYVTKYNAEERMYTKKILLYRKLKEEALKEIQTNNPDVEVDYNAHVITISKPENPNSSPKSSP